MKHVAILIAISVAIAAAFLSTPFYSPFYSWTKKAELPLVPRNEAKQAIGHCGDQSVATVKNGDLVEIYVAGNRVTSFTVAEYFQK